MAISHIFSHGFCHLRRQVDLCNDGPVTVELSGTKAVAGARRSAVARLGRLGGELGRCGRGWGDLAIWEEKLRGKIGHLIYLIGICEIPMLAI